MTKSNYTHDPISFAKNFMPSTVGFDKVFQDIENASRSVTKALTNYPPYNIKKVNDNQYIIELAVSGFSKQDVEVTIQDDVLTIKGHTSLDTLTQDGTDFTYLYKGIADRAFTRSFALSDTIELKNAQLINGMLKLFLENIIPETKKAKKVEIT